MSDVPNKNRVAAMQLNRADLTVVLVPTEIQARDTLIAQAKQIQAVEDELDAEVCGNTLRELQAMAKAVEANRTEVKNPVLELSRKIDGLAKEFATPIDAELGRLKAMFSKYQAEQIRRAQEAEAKRQAEARRIEEEARAKAEEQRKAEAALLEGEAQPPAPEPPKAPPAELLLPLPPKPKPVPTPAGISARTVWTFEVTDIHALYKSHPEWVQLEPLRAEINKALANGLRECPGLAITQETKTTVRA